MHGVTSDLDASRQLGVGLHRRLTVVYLLAARLHNRRSVGEDKKTAEMVAADERPFDVIPFEVSGAFA